MKTSFTFLIMLSILLYNVDIAAAQGRPNSANWSSILKAVCQVIGIGCVINELNNINAKQESMPTSDNRAQGHYDTRKFALFAASGAIVASFTNDWAENVKRWAVFTGLLGLTHITANNKGVVSGLRTVPFAGPLLTDPVDHKGTEKSCVGQLIRCVSTYMAYRTLGKNLIPGLDRYLV